MVYTQGRLISIPIFFILNMVSEPGSDPGTCGLWAHHFFFSSSLPLPLSSPLELPPLPDLCRTAAKPSPDLRRTFAGSSPDLCRTLPDHRRRTSAARVPILTSNLEVVPPLWRLPLPLPILKTLLVCLTRPSTLTMLMYTYPLTS